MEKPTTIEHAGPAVGEHSSEFYKELLGVDDEKLQALKADGVI